LLPPDDSAAAQKQELHVADMELSNRFNMIPVGSAVPPCTLMELPSVEEGCPKAAVAINVVEALKDKTVVMFFVPGAYTPVCSEQHAPEFVKVCVCHSSLSSNHRNHWAEAQGVHCCGCPRGTVASHRAVPSQRRA
jgi:hypothetical protein